MVRIAKALPPASQSSLSSFGLWDKYFVSPFMNQSLLSGLPTQVHPLCSSESILLYLEVHGISRFGFLSQHSIAVYAQKL